MVGIRERKLRGMWGGGRGWGAQAGKALCPSLGAWSSSTSDLLSGDRAAEAKWEKGA